MADHDKKNNESEMGEHDKKNNESDSAPNDPTTTDTTGEKDEKDPNAGKPNEVTDPPKNNPTDSTGAGYNLAAKIREGIDAINGLGAHLVELSTIKATVKPKKVESDPKAPPQSKNEKDNDDENKNNLNTSPK